MKRAAESAAEEPNAQEFGALAAGAIAIREKRIVWASERFAEIAGRATSDLLLGESLADLFADSGSGLPDPLTRRAVECGLVRPNRELRSVICRLVDREAGSETAMWVIEDVTHVRILERELLKLSQELHQASRDTTSLRERLRREGDEREELLTVVSHELRTPVTIISGYNRLLLTEQIGSLNDEQRRFLTESSNACNRLNTFIGNLLEASRTSRDGEVLEIGHAKLAPVVEEVVGLLRPLLDAGGLKVQMSVDPDADYARFDRTRLGQVLTNLLGNAIKFSPAGGTIGIETRRVPFAREGGPERSCVEFLISDGGPGVAPEDRDRIFEPYVQVGDECRAGGLGLGLAICKNLVEAHGGSIRVLDQGEAGSCFAFTVPVSEANESIQAGDR
jgi:signal transduction histidine kinase